MHFCTFGKYTSSLCIRILLKYCSTTTNCPPAPPQQIPEDQGGNNNNENNIENNADESRGHSSTKMEDKVTAGQR